MTLRHPLGTAGMEPASGRGVHRAGDVPFEQLPLAPMGGVRDRNRFEQGLSVRVQGSRIKIAFGC